MNRRAFFTGIAAVIAAAVVPFRARAVVPPVSTTYHFERANEEVIRRFHALLTRYGPADPIESRQFIDDLMRMHEQARAELDGARC